MRFTRDEIERARRLRKLGLPWRPSIGDWYVTADGFVGILTGNGDALEVVGQHTWLPLWGDCRSWLRERGFTHPEFPTDEETEIGVEFITSTGEMVRGTASTDRACLYAVMEHVLQGSR